MWEMVLFFLWYIPFMWESKIQLVLESLQDECSLVSNSYLQYLHDIKIPLKIYLLKKSNCQMLSSTLPLGPATLFSFCKCYLAFGLRCCHNSIWLSESLLVMLNQVTPLQLLCWRYTTARFARQSRAGSLLQIKDYPQHRSQGKTPKRNISWFHQQSNGNTNASMPYTWVGKKTTCCVKRKT